MSRRTKRNPAKIKKILKKLGYKSGKVPRSYVAHHIKPKAKGGKDTPKNMQITINLDKKQFKELLLDVMVGIFIRGGVADVMGQNFQKMDKMDKVEDYLLEQAKAAGFYDLIQDFKGHLLPSDELCDAEETIMEIYDDDEFWHQIVMRLGQRDFEREKTPADEKYVKEHNGQFPEKIQQFYDKYEKEFERNGIDNLEIVKDNVFILNGK